ESHVPCIDVSPRGGISSMDQHLASEVQDVATADERHLIRQVEQVLFVVRVDTRLQSVVEARDVDGRKKVRLGELHTKLGRPALPQRLRRKEIIFPHESETELVHGGGADAPVI